MSDLERRLEELFLDESRSRKVQRVEVIRRRRSPVFVTFAAATAALLALAAGLTLGSLRDAQQEAAASPTPFGQAVSPPQTSPSPPSSSECPDADARPPALSGAKLGRFAVMSLDSVTMGADYDARWTMRIGVSRDAPGELQLETRRIAVSRAGGEVPVFEVRPASETVAINGCAMATFELRTKSIGTGEDIVLTISGIRLPEGGFIDARISLLLRCDPGPPSATTCTTAGGTSGASPPPTAGPPTAALPGADRFALVVERGCAPPGPAPYLRGEDRDAVIARLGPGYLCQLSGAVSPDGRRLAYWLYETGRSEIAIYEAGSSRTAARLGDEFAFGMVWSSDGTGILFAAQKGGVQGVPPEYAALRTLDVASGTVRELMRVEGRPLRALAWDRAARVTAAWSTAPTDEGEYLVVAEDGSVRRHPLPARSGLIGASSDARYVLAWSHTPNEFRYWPLGSFADQTSLRPEAGCGVGNAAWRPGAVELAVVAACGSTTARIELWGLDGSRRRLGEHSGQSGGLFFRPDGSVLFVGSDTAIDVTSGQVARLALGPQERIVASLAR